MASALSRDLLPQLSNHQRFILAYVRHRERFNRSFVWTRMPDTIYTERISRALAAEFDEHGDRIDEPDDPPQKIARASTRGETCRLIGSIVRRMPLSPRTHVSVMFDRTTPRRFRDRWPVWTSVS